VRSGNRTLATVVASLCAAAVFAGLVPAASAAGTLDYAALGDSQASGLGAGSYHSSSGDCKRSNNSYAAIYAKQKQARNFLFTACSGATTGSIAGQAARMNSSTDLVTVQVGGNDVGFAQTLLICRTGSDAQCGAALDQAAVRIHGLGGSLDNAYRSIRSKATRARVVVVGYPRMFETGACSGEMSAYKRSRINSAIDQLANVTRGRASAAGFAFVDSNAKFAGHGVCSGSAWFRGLTSPIQESYHPMASGQYWGFYRSLVGVIG
jgi:lysophospholipase L1-like esterase